LTGVPAFRIAYLCKDGSTISNPSQCDIAPGGLALMSYGSPKIHPQRRSDGFAPAGSPHRSGPPGLPWPLALRGGMSPFREVAARMGLPAALHVVVCGMSDFDMRMIAAVPRRGATA
jgi:hypothetical protein